MSLPLLYHFSYLFKLQITSLLRLNVFEQFSGTKKYLWVLQLSYTNFSSQSPHHNCNTLLLQVSPFLRENVDKGFFH